MARGRKSIEKNIPGGQQITMRGSVGNRHVDIRPAVKEVGFTMVIRQPGGGQLSVETTIQPDVLYDDNKFIPTGLHENDYTPEFKGDAHHPHRMAINLQPQRPISFAVASGMLEGRKNRVEKVTIGLRPTRGKHR